MDRTSLHSQHAFQQVCLPALAWLLRSHSCGDRSQAAHCRGPSFPPLDRCSPLNRWPHNQHFSSCPVWPLGRWNERTRAFGSSWHELKKNLDHWCEREFIAHFICHLLEVSMYNFEIAEDVYIFPQVTYVLEGVTAHEDFCGHSGRLKPGDLQVLNFWHVVIHFKDL